MKSNNVKQSKWKYPILYIVFLIIAFLPLYTQKPYVPQDTNKVIFSVSSTAYLPYGAFAPIFHIATICITLALLWKPKWAIKVLFLYMGVNYLILTFVQGIGNTPQYGFIVSTGAVVMYAILGFLWISVAVRKEIQNPQVQITWKNLLLLPLAILAFWVPYSMTNNVTQPNFNPLLLLTSSEYGLTFCLTTPVFLFLLTLFYPQINKMAYRLTAFNGFLYGLFNLALWVNPDTRWMGFLHLPLLIISGYALVLSTRRKTEAPRLEELAPQK